MNLAFILGRITTADHGDIDPEIVFTEKHRALTGSESSLLHTARALALRGHAVTVYCWSRFEFGAFDGLLYRHAELGVGNDHDAYVSLSEPDLLRGAPGLKVCWQQQNTFDYVDAGYNEHVDTYVALSPKHREHMIAVTRTPGTKWVWIPNSIVLEPFDRTMARRPNSLAWLSSPDRGLHILLSMWPQIRKRVPDATLRVFYRFDEWAAKFKQQHQKSWNSARAAYITECLRRLGRNGENGITVVGAVPRPKVIEELLQTQAVAYTFESHTFVEGFAVAALDALAAGCHLIIPDSDALGDIYDGVAEIIPGKPQLAADKWVDAVVHAFARDGGEDVDARAWARNFSAERVAELWEQLLLRNTAALPKSIRAFTRSTFDPVAAPVPVPTVPLAPAPTPTPATIPTPTGAPAVSVVVLLSRPGGIDITLAAMRDQTWKDFELILVDNRYERRHDQLMALARAYGLKNVIHVPEHRRNGKWIVAAAAFNTGFAIARGKYVLVLHDFAYVGPGWIESHLKAHTGQRQLVVAHHQNVDLPELIRTLPENMETNRGSVEDDPAFAALDELRIFKRGEFNASWLPLPISDKQWQPPFRTWFRSGRPTDRVWITLTNDSFEREFLMQLGGVDERFDLCRATLDMDMGLRIVHAGGSFVWNDDAAAEATLLNPRFVMRTKPFGQHHASIDGRWTERDAHDYNAIVAGRRAVRPNNPYEIETLAQRLESWRRPGAICTPSEVDDRTYYGGTIPVPEAPAIVHWQGPAPALDPYERAERDAYLEIRPAPAAAAPAPPIPREPMVSIVIPCFRPGGLDITLAGLRDQTYKNFETIIVDNRYEKRHAQVVALAAQHKLDVVHVPEHRRNGPWVVACAGYNTGAALARGRYVLFATDFSYLPPGWIERAIEHLEDHAQRWVTLPYVHMDLPTVRATRDGVIDWARSRRVEIMTEPDEVTRGGVLDEMHIFADGPFESSWVARSQISTRCVNGDTLPWQDHRQRLDHPIVVDERWVPMRFEAVRREFLWRLNGFDERYSFGRGPWDWDTAMRVRNAGGEILWHPQAPEALYYNPHWLSQAKPFGGLTAPVPGRWTEAEGRAYFARRQAQGAVRAPNPFEISQLARELAPWRHPLTACEPRDISDRAYFRCDVSPDSPTED